MPIKGLDSDLGDGPLAIHQVEKVVLEDRIWDAIEKRLGRK